MGVNFAKEIEMNNLPNCPKCNSEYVYEDGALLVCPECAYEWNPAEVVDEGVVAIDANGNKLAMAILSPWSKTWKWRVHQKIWNKERAWKTSVSSKATTTSIVRLMDLAQWNLNQNLSRKSKDNKKGLAPFLSGEYYEIQTIV